MAAGALTINNQLKAVTTMATKMAILTAMTMKMETKGTAVAAEAQQQHGDGGQLGRVAAAWQEHGISGGGQLGGGYGSLQERSTGGGGSAVAE
jgi:hypothetical protein